MERALDALKFYFRNGDTWVVKHNDISDLWISRVTTSYGRIKGGKMTIIHPCKSFKAEFLPDADAVDPDATNLSSVTSGMFERVLQYQDIEKLDILFGDERGSERVYLPFKAKDVDGIDNVYQTSSMSKDGKLHLVVDDDRTVIDVYKDHE
ncbi:hypothetical protein [Lactiplantibacillus fabifermentans]|uniref:Uncharacterized protein n=2 Tax=Lactiplantibacillus fabifermentans TaxID=483011 RepID=A0A0R2NEB2_9LACO|nr:hypothetical protein [Lactiplantibacillus fabifermentans]ETY74230.1 hypothetical protein LFAB_08135 [Lactiplantibacillus fabifermentans T30PCM01]KRO23708.1 hypothetical protein DY78_GL001745 [Lactiplantibacillus fabifermentans DSM 21115]